MIETQALTDTIIVGATIGRPPICTRCETKASTSQTLAAASFRGHFLGLACKAERTAKLNEQISLRPRGVVASVQDVRAIKPLFGTDDGRGVASARLCDFTTVPTLPPPIQR